MKFFGKTFQSSRGWTIEAADDIGGTSLSDTFLMGGGNDTIRGWNGHDEIFAGRGNDRIYGGMGDDTIDGGTGHDVIRPEGSIHSRNEVRAWGDDKVTGGLGNDTIDYRNSTSELTLRGDNIGFSSEDGDDFIQSGTGHDRIWGGGGDDRIWGNKGDDKIWGDAASSIFGGADLIHGGSGDDQIKGGGGNDTIWGDSGVDILTGGSGRDKFAFEDGDSGTKYADADVIKDFTLGEDRLQFDVAGTKKNFGHIVGFLDTDGLSEKGAYNAALKFANNATATLPNIRYEFVTDGENGWLFVNSDGKHGFEMGIELKGTTDLHYQDITAF